jgi:hypothetical protein
MLRICFLFLILVVFFSINYDSLIKNADAEESKVFESPLKQLFKGIDPTKIACKPDFQLALKASNNFSVCIRNDSAPILFELGWTNHEIDTSLFKKKMPNPYDRYDKILQELESGRGVGVFIYLNHDLSNNVEQKILENIPKSPVFEKRDFKTASIFFLTVDKEGIDYLLLTPLVESIDHNGTDRPN